MKLLRMISRDFRDAVKSVFRNISLSMASLSCIVITLILVALAIITSYNINNFSKNIKNDFTIVVFLENEIDQEGISEVKTKIVENKNIEEYTFQGKQDIAKEMMESSNIYKNIMETWSEEDNPLKDTFVIKVKDIDKITKTAQDIEKISGVYSVNYGEGIIEKFLKIFKMIEKALIIVVVLFVLITMLLITNTIKLTIFARKREIEIMRLVGASNFNIELPFIFEGFILGFFGSILPVITIIYGYTYLFDNFDGQIFSPFIKLVEPTPFVYAIALIILSLGIFVGMFSSFRAVKKYLKV
ncbi:MAG: ABC transporter permease [Mollicutes bacterium]|nr:ABC transporter permease [Mollicutes bacterium]